MGASATIARVAIISRDRGYLFIQTPQTGCSAIAQKVLIPQLEGKQVLERSIRNRRGRVVVDQKHCTLGQILELGVLDRDDAARLLKFSAVRNPFDAVVSDYAKRRTQYAPLVDRPNSWIHRRKRMVRNTRYAFDHSFEEWVRRVYRIPFPRSLVRGKVFVRGTPFQDGMDMVMRFEHLQEDFDKVLARLGVEPIEIPRFHITEGRTADYRDYYTPETRALVETAYRPLLDRFGYSF